MTLSFSDEIAVSKDYLPPAPAQRGTAGERAARLGGSSTVPGLSNLQTKVDSVIDYIASAGFVFEPWQVATFITAVRTKPFIILAGISGTGKTKLPRLVAEATGAECMMVPVRPDWTDSSDLLGFERINGVFSPGSLLRFAKRACDEPEKQFFLILDEMNIARVEYYLAEILSHLEEKRPNADGRVVSEPLMPHISDDGEQWSQVRLPENLCIIGSVNMDETTHGFSKKVLDRSFVIEFSTIDLAAIGNYSDPPILEPWTAHDWKPSSNTLASHPDKDSSDVQQMIETLIAINKSLEPGQLQFGYRVRDEIVLFCLAAEQCASSFTTSSSGTVDPLDIAIAMKVLPRIQGGGGTIRGILEELRNWASPDESENPEHSQATGFSFCADRISIMIRRLRESGFTSYWL